MKIKGTLQRIRNYINFRISKLKRKLRKRPNRINLIRWRLWFWVFDRPPLTVFQMGKVGSKTISASLKKNFEEKQIQSPVYHNHILNNFDEIAKKLIKFQGLENIDISQKIPPELRRRGLGVIKRGREIRRMLSADPYLQWEVVSLVREPVGRNVGTFFQTLHYIFPNWIQDYRNGLLTIKKLQEVLINTPRFNWAPSHWFEEQLEPVFHIDVYATPFPKEQGFKIYESKRARLLLIRLEDLNRVVAQAMYDFFKIDNFELYNANIGENKEYGDIYKEFKQHYLPNEYVTKLYNTKLARHFYSQEELDNFKVKWIGTN